MTALLMASKFDEIDNKLIFIPDLHNHVKLSLQLKKESNDAPLDTSMIPKWADLTECERHYLRFFDFNINFVLVQPFMFLEAFLSIGVLLPKKTNRTNIEMDRMIINFRR